jgi:hypothetical protein
MAAIESAIFLVESILCLYQMTPCKSKVNGESGHFNDVRVLAWSLSQLLKSV